MFSKSAFAALLKTLEEPPPYLKFIFASTDVKKIPVTIISRCQRYDLSRIKSEELFDYLIKIKNLEKAKISDDALKLIVKLSEGSVRDSLSLLDRVMLVENDSKEIDLKIAQKIFGYFEKSIIINLIENIIDGDEVKTLRLYKDIYNSGVEPKVFLNEFLETIYYVKNISFINLDGNNFDLNDKEFEKIKSLSSNLDNKDILLLWQFTLDNLEKIDFVKNQYQFIEMFLIRSLYLKKITKKNTNLFVTESNQDIKIDKTILANQTQPQKEVVDQLKNIKQEKNIQVNPKIKNKNTGLKIESLKDLAELCEQNRELKIKYDIENNLRLVSIKDQKIEISFNSTLDKSFVKELSNKLLEWTGKRWIIAFSKENGSQTLKEQSQNLKINLFKKESESGFSKEIKNIFPDAELLKVEEDENI